MAYADFVTAMMALFLVLWLTAQDSKIKEAVERAFRNPFSSVTKESMGILPSKDAQATHEQKGNFDSPSAAQLELLRRVTDDLAKMLEQDPEAENSVKIEMMKDGVRINIFDKGFRPIFEPESASFTAYGTWVFSTLAWEIARYTTFHVELEGHTQKGFSTSKESYSAWDLSADRANATRRKLVDYGVGETQISKVSGLAATQPMPNSPPEADTNRRVTVILKVQPEGVQEQTAPETASAVPKS